MAKSPASFTRRLTTAALAALVFVSAAYLSWTYFFPLESHEFSTRLDLWRAGVTESKLGEMHAYERNLCKDATKPFSCTCVVLIHGLADNALTWKRILIWPESGWPAPVHLVALDLPGSGRSPAPKDSAEYRVRTQAQEISEALAPVCPRWTAVGNSLGGWIAAWLALDWRQVNKLILIDSAGLKVDGQNKNAGLLTTPTVESMKEFQKRAYYHTRPIPDHVWDQIVDHLKKSDAAQVVAAQNPDDFLDARLGALNRPTLLLWGEADQITPLAQGERFHELIPGSIWREVPKCGHLPQKECPLAVIRAITDMAKFGKI